MMKKIIYMVSLMALLVTTSYGFEAGSLSLDTPHVLSKKQGSMAIRHRFYGEFDDYEKFLGSDDGGNMHFIFKHYLLSDIVLRATHSRHENSYTLGLEYAKDIKWIKVGLVAEAISANKSGFEERQKSYFTNLSLQSPNYFDHIRFNANIGYDSYYKHKTLGLGIDINVKNFIPYMTFTQRISLIGEYYPQIDTTEGISGDDDSYAFGLKFTTYAHHFELVLSNSTHMDPRMMALGTNSDNLHFGFNINRRF